MERSVLIVSVLLAIGCLLDSVLSEEKIEEKEMHRDVQTKGAFWFGPRLGRRKRNPYGEETFITPTLERIQLDALVDDLQNSPWTILTNGPYKGKRKTVNFTPRLGRDSGEDFNSGASTLGGSIGDRRLLESDVPGEFMMQRSPPFAPRLGRRVAFSPRMGRDSD